MVKSMRRTRLKGYPRLKKLKRFSKVERVKSEEKDSPRLKELKVKSVVTRLGEKVLQRRAREEKKTRRFRHSGQKYNIYIYIYITTLTMVTNAYVQ